MPDTPASTEDHDREITPAEARRLFFTVFPSLVLPLFLGVIDQTIVATALPNIVGEMGEVERASWIVIAYLVANTIASAVYGRLGDTMGRKKLMFWSLGIFMASSVLCGLCHSIETLTVARLLQGIGGGGLFTLSTALLGEAIPPRLRVRYQGYMATIGILGNSLGPIVGGFMAAHWGWRSIFFINVPFGAVAIYLTMRLPTRKGSGGSLVFDFPGLALFAFFIAPTLLVFEQMRQFKDPFTPAGLIAVAVLSLVLLYRQEKRAVVPLFPLSVVGEPSLWRCCVLSAFHGAAMTSLITFVPIYLRVVRGVGAAELGLVIMPLTLLIPVASMLTSRLITLTGMTAPIPAVGLIVPTVTLAILGVFAPQMSLLMFSAVLGVTALGMGTAMTVAQVVVQIVAGPTALGVGAAAVLITRSVGAAFGTAGVGAVLFSVLHAQDPNAISVFAQLMEGGAEVMARMPRDQALTLQAGLSSAFSWAFVVVACFTAGGMLISWTIPSRRL